MLAAIARALRLTRDERDHLFHLAGRLLPTSGSGTDHIHPGLLDLLDRLADTPAQLITDLHVTLMQNPLAIALLGQAAPLTGPRASFVYRWFTDPRARDLYPEADHAQQSASFVADLRAAAGRRAATDPDTTTIISELHQRNPEFIALWNHHNVAVRRNERKRIVHPTIGTIEVNCLNLFSEDNRQRLLWFTPALGTPAIEQLELLTVLGTQDLSSTR
jgi:MmyB-like transcription regulator ligand binding domain